MAIGTVRVRKVIGRYRVSRDRGRKLVKGKNDQEPRLRLGFWLVDYAADCHPLRFGRFTLGQVQLEHAIIYSVTE